MNLKFSQQVFEKVSNMKFRQNPFSGTEVFHAEGRTDGRTDGRT
jgi:hypothetical protein